jgi:hypothetical protein
MRARRLALRRRVDTDRARCSCDICVTASPAEICAHEEHLRLVCCSASFPLGVHFFFLACDVHYCIFWQEREEYYRLLVTTRRSAQPSQSMVPTRVTTTCRTLVEEPRGTRLCEYPSQSSRLILIESPFKSYSDIILINLNLKFVTFITLNLEVH